MCIKIALKFAHIRNYLKSHNHSCSKRPTSPIQLSWRLAIRIIFYYSCLRVYTTRSVHNIFYCDVMIEHKIIYTYQM